LCNYLPGFEDFRSEISDLRSRAESISRQLRAWCNSAQNSDIRGQRYLTEKERRRRQQAKEQDEFLKEQAKEREKFLKELEENRRRRSQ